MPRTSEDKPFSSARVYGYGNMMKYAKLRVPIFANDHLKRLDNRVPSVEIGR